MNSLSREENLFEKVLEVLNLYFKTHILWRSSRINDIITVLDVASPHYTVDIRRYLDKTFGVVSVEKFALSNDTVKIRGWY